MSPSVAQLPLKTAVGTRDLIAEADIHVRKITINATAASLLCPLDTPEKTDEVTPFWTGFYEVLSTTTLDDELVDAILQHEDILKLMPDIRRVMGECEGALETTWAGRVASAETKAEALRVFNSTPIHEFYTHVLKMEWATLLAIMGRTPASVGILGSGAMPETGVWIKNWVREKGETVRIYSLELVPSRLEVSRKVFEQLCGTDNCTFESGDIVNTPQDLKDHDVVYFNAAVGATSLEKENLLLDVVSRMRPGAFVISRSTNSLKKMAYPPAQHRTHRVMKRLRPISATHLDGEAGHMASASFIISRVI